MLKRATTYHLCFAEEVEAAKSEEIEEAKDKQKMDENEYDLEIDLDEILLELPKEDEPDPIVLEKILCLLKDNDSAGRGQAVFILSNAAPYFDGLAVTPAQQTFWYYMQHFWSMGAPALQKFLTVTKTVSGGLDKEGWWRIQENEVKEMFECLLVRNQLVEDSWQRLLDLLENTRSPFLCATDNDWRQLGETVDFVLAIIEKDTEQNDALERLLSGNCAFCVRWLALAALALNLGEQAMGLLKRHRESEDAEMSRIAAQFIKKFEGQ